MINILVSRIYQGISFNPPVAPFSPTWSATKGNSGLVSIYFGRDIQVIFSIRGFDLKLFSRNPSIFLPKCYSQSTFKMKPAIWYLILQKQVPTSIFIISCWMNRWSTFVMYCYVMIHDFCSQHSKKFSEFSNQKVTFDSWRRDVPRRSGIRKATSMASRPVEMWWTGTQRPSSMAWPSERLPRSWRSMTGSSGGEHHPKNRENMGHDDHLYGKKMIYIYNIYIYM